MAAGEAMLDYLHANKDVWVGHTYWAGGAWWRNYGWDVQPTKDAAGNWGPDKTQMSVLSKYTLPETHAADLAI